MAEENKLRQDLTEALDHSIELLNLGKSAEECLALYPSLREELEPLLQVALGLRVVKKAWASPTFRSRVRAKINHHFSRGAQKTPSVAQRFFSWGPRWALAASVAFAVLLGTGTIRAAADSPPDSPLYMVKRATEEVQLTLTPSKVGKAKFLASLADRRTREIATMAARSDPQRIEWLASMLNHHLERAAALVSETDDYAAVASTPDAVTPMMGPMMGSPESPYSVALKEENQPPGPIRKQRKIDPELIRLRDMLRQNATIHQQMLEKAMMDTPPTGRAMMSRIILENRLSYQQALRYLEQLGPGD